MANVVVVGSQWGDEGKGKIVDWLSERADVVVRFQGGHNAGHTLVIDGKTYKLSLLPSGIVRGKLSVIGNGVVIDPWALADEIERLEGVRVPLGTLDITLYRDDLSTIAHHPVVKETRFPGSIDEQRLVLCDDVLFTGRTVRAALGALVDYGRPQRVELAVLIDRGHRELPIQGDYVGKTIETERDELVEVLFPSTDGSEQVQVLEREA